MEHRDPEGRFILVKGVLDDHLYALFSCYAPNKGQTTFFQAMLQTLGPLVEDTVVLGGDSNTAFDQGLNKTKPPILHSLKEAPKLPN